MGDEVVYQYEDTEFKRNDQMASKVFCDVQLTSTPEKETVSITYFNSDSEDYSLSSGHMADFYRGIVDVLKNMEYETVAEGVETEGELELVFRWGVD